MSEYRSGTNTDLTALEGLKSQYLSLGVDGYIKKYNILVILLSTYNFKPCSRETIHSKLTDDITDAGELLIYGKEPEFCSEFHSYLIIRIYEDIVFSIKNYYEYSTEDNDAKLMYKIWARCREVVHKIAYKDFSFDDDEIKDKVLVECGELDYDLFSMTLNEITSQPTVAGDVTYYDTIVEYLENGSDDDVNIKVDMNVANLSQVAYYLYKNGYTDNITKVCAVLNSQCNTKDSKLWLEFIHDIYERMNKENKIQNHLTN